MVALLLPLPLPLTRPPPLLLLRALLLLLLLLMLLLLLLRQATTTSTASAATTTTTSITSCAVTVHIAWTPLPKVCFFCGSSFILIAFLCKRLKCQPQPQVFGEAAGVAPRTVGFSTKGVRPASELQTKLHKAQDLSRGVVQSLRLTDRHPGRCLYCHQRLFRMLLGPASSFPRPSRSFGPTVDDRNPALLY